MRNVFMYTYMVFYYKREGKRKKEIH